MSTIPRAGRFAPLLLAALLLAPAAFAQSAEHTIDPQTGEPVPAAVAAPPAEAPPRASGLDLVPIQHLPEGSTKLVRVLDSTHALYQNGAALLSAEVMTGNATIFIEERDRLLLPGQPTDAVVRDGRAYVAVTKGGGLRILDLSDPTALDTVGSAPGVDLFAVALAGDIAFGGRGTAGIAVYDIVDPANPTLLSTTDTPGSANGLAVRDTLLLVADGNVASGPDFRIYGIGTPTAPQLLGTLEAGSFVTYVAVREAVAYLTGGFGLMTVDVSDPAAPQMLDTFAAGGETTYEVAFAGDTAFVAGLAGIFAVDVQDPANLTQVAAFTDVGQGLSVASDPARFLTLLGDRFEGLRAFDNSSGMVLREAGYAPNGGFSHKAAFDGDYLYVTDLAGGLRIFDTGPLLDGTGAAAEIARIEVPPNTQEVLVRDGRAYVTDADFGGTGLTILDVSDPANPSIIGGWNSPNQAFGLDLVRDTLYLANGFTGLQVLDVSDPTSVQPLGSFPMGSNTVDVVVDSTEAVAFVVNFGAGMYSLDVRDPANIQQLDAETGWGFLNAIDLSGRSTSYSTVLVADASQGLRVVDITEPEMLVTAELFPVTTQARDVAWTNAHGVPATRRGGYWAAATVADDFFGLHILVQWEGLYRTFASADRGMGVAYRERGYLDHFVVLASGETGLYFIEGPIVVSNELDAPLASLRLDAVAPNPARTATSIHYALPEAGPVVLAVYDLLGRRITTLVNGEQRGGSHEVRFDNAGLPSGVYVVRLQAAGRVAATRMTVVR